MNIYNEGSRELTVYDNVDTVVVGGGVAGCIEAIRAARKGEKVVLVEQYAILGGYLTSGGHPKMNNAVLKDGKDEILDEIFKNVIAERGTRYNSLEELKQDREEEFLVDPEVVNVVLMDMCIKAKVELNMLTMFCDSIVENNVCKGVVLQNKSGRYAVIAKRTVDATGSGKVAVAAGESFEYKAEFEDCENYGIPLRIGHVNLDKFVDYIVNSEIKDNDSFVDLLASKTGLSKEELALDSYYSKFVERKAFTGEVYDKAFQDKIKKLYEEDGRLYNVGIQMFSDVLEKADKEGTLEFEAVKDGVTLRFNFEGFSFEKWRHGEVVANLVAVKEAFIEEDSTNEADLETVTRRRALDTANMLKKYIPGFEKSYLISTACKTYSANTRVITSKNVGCLELRRDYDYLFRTC